MLKTNMYFVDDFGKSSLAFIFGYDEDKDEVEVLFKEESANPRSFLENWFTGKDGMFSAKDGKKFIEQLADAMSNTTRAWASGAYK